jgi:hypothetical protein
MNDPKYIHIYISSKCHKCLKNIHVQISRRLMNPPTPMSTKMGINYPIQKWAPKPIHKKIGTQGALRAPPHVLCQLEVPHQLGPSSLGGIRPVIVAPCYCFSMDQGSPLYSVHPHTAPGPPHPIYGPTYSQVNPIKPARSVFAGPLASPRISLRLSPWSCTNFISSSPLSNPRLYRH